MGAERGSSRDRVTAAGDRPVRDGGAEVAGRFCLNRLYNMDCMKAMQEIPDKFFEIAIVDPPYGINEKFKGGKSGKLNFNEIVEKKWDIAPKQDYFKELFRVSKNQIIFGGNYFDLPPTRCFIVWDKKIPENFSLAMAELAWTSFDKLAKIVRMSVPKDGSKIHPTQKPVALYEWIISRYTQEGDKILDTHAGSGSCLVEAHRTRHPFLGFEIDEKYFTKADERIRQEQAQMSIFDFMGGNGVDCREEKTGE